jgi:hypothetical protein
MLTLARAYEWSQVLRSRAEVVDSLAEGDKVVGRNIWTGTDARTGKRMEFHGFVLAHHRPSA